MQELIPAAQKYFRNRFDGIIRIEIEGVAEPLWIDGRSTPPKISKTAPENVSDSFCLWRTNRETILRLFRPGFRQLEAAYIAGRLTISGDMSVLARLEVGDPSAAA